METLPIVSSLSGNLQLGEYLRKLGATVIASFSLAFEGSRLGPNLALFSGVLGVPRP